MHFFDGGFYMGFGGIWMVLWWILIIAGIVALVKWLVDSSTPRNRDIDRGSPGKTALDILKERYARGEIDQEEFREKMRDLGS